MPPVDRPRPALNVGSRFPSFIESDIIVVMRESPRPNQVEPSFARHLGTRMLQGRFHGTAVLSIRIIRLFERTGHGASGAAGIIAATRTSGYLCSATNARPVYVEASGISDAIGCDDNARPYINRIGRPNCGENHPAFRRRHKNETLLGLRRAWLASLEKFLAEYPDFILLRSGFAK
jgi:hypothetical protein